MLDWLAARARISPESIAIYFSRQRMTYGFLDAQATQLAARLSSLGVKRGQHIAAYMSSSPDYVVLVFALMRLGAVLVPLNTRLTSDELRWQIPHADVDLIVYSSDLKEAAPALSSTGRDVLAFHSSGNLKAPNPERFDQAEIDLNDVHSIIFTSGTSGQPKAAVLTYGNHFYSAMASAYRIGLRPDDLWLSCLPLYHVGGMAVFLRSCLYGTSVDLHRSFEPLDINHSLDTLPVSIISVVPTMLYRMLSARLSWNLPHLRCVLLGGAAASEDLLRRAAERNVPVHTTYGLTEAASQVATALPREVQRKPGSVGKPLMFTSVHIANQHGRTLPTGEPGEVVVSGPTVMKAYHENPAATAAALKDGELYTGDIGYIDEDGDLFILQRRTDLIVSGGENVLPSEVEDVLLKHSAIGEVVVVGIPHPEWGQQVAAMVILNGAHSKDFSSESLQEHCREHLAGYKIPRIVKVVSEFPLTPSGKVRRKDVIQQLESYALS